MNIDQLTAILAGLTLLTSILGFFMTRRTQYKLHDRQKISDLERETRARLYEDLKKLEEFVSLDDKVFSVAYQVFYNENDDLLADDRLQYRNNLRRYAELKNEVPDLLRAWEPSGIQSKLAQTLGNNTMVATIGFVEAILGIADLNRLKIEFPKDIVEGYKAASDEERKAINSEQLSRFIKENHEIRSKLVDWRVKMITAQSPLQDPKE